MAYTYDEALALPADQRVDGLKVSGAKPPFGGTWEYDPVADELTLKKALNNGEDK